MFARDDCLALSMRSAKKLELLDDFVLRPPARLVPRPHFISITSSVLDQIHGQSWTVM